MVKLTRRSIMVLEHPISSMGTSKIMARYGN
jgi:hypothetical protein